jgi:translation initiation factor 1A
MPKKIKARKNTKTQVTERMSQTKRELLLKEPGQEYAKITRMLGERRVECELYLDGNSNGNSKTKIGKIRTGMKRKGAFISQGDVVLISVRDFQEDKVDIIHQYNKGEIELLKKKKHIPRESTECSLFSYSDDEEEEDGDQCLIDGIIDGIIDDKEDFLIFI